MFEEDVLDVDLGVDLNNFMYCKVIWRKQLRFFRFLMVELIGEWKLVWDWWKEVIEFRDFVVIGYGRDIDFSFKCFCGG